MNTSAWNGHININYADQYKQPYYQKNVAYTDCYNKNGGKIDHVLSAQNFVPEEPMRGIIITSAGNLSLKMIDGSILTRKWPANTFIDNMVISQVMSASVTLSATKAKDIYPLW